MPAYIIAVSIKLNDESEKSVQIRVNTLSTLLLVLSAMLVPMYFTDFRLPTGGVIIRLADIMSLAIIGLFAVCYLQGKVELYLPKGFIFLTLFLIYCFLNALSQSGLFKALVATFQWFMILFTLAIVYSHSIAHPQRFKKIFFTTLLSICFLVVLYHFSIGHFMRYKSLGDAKYILALTGMLILAFSYYYQDKRYLLALCIIYPFILLSLERKGILAFHVVLFIYLCFSMKSLAKIGLLTCIGAFVILMLNNPDILDYSNFHLFEYNEYEMMNLDEEQALWVSDLHRQSLLENGWDIFQSNWVFGVGPKMLTYSMIDYYYDPHLALYTHNVFLDTLIEQGVIGLLLLFSPYFIYICSGKVKLGREAVCFFSFCVYSSIMLFFMSGGAPSMVLFYLPLFSGFILNNKNN